MPRRLPDWPERLAAYLDRCQDLPFAWGGKDADCSLFAAGDVEALTGEHPCPDLVGTYHDEATAAVVMQELGGLEAAVTGMLGPPLPSVNLAHRGDVVIFPFSGTDRLGIIGVNGDRITVKTESGLSEVRRERARLAWPVGWSPDDMKLQEAALAPAALEKPPEPVSADEAVRWLRYAAYRPEKCKFEPGKPWPVLVIHGVRLVFEADLHLNTIYTDEAHVGTASDWDGRQPWNELLDSESEVLRKLLKMKGAA